MIKESFNNFQEEVELFFMTKFITGKQLEQTYSECLDIVFDISGTMDSTRGIIAHNPKYGQGKSFFFDVIRHRHRRLKGKNLFIKTSAKELCEIYTSTAKGSNPETRLLKFISVKRLYIDDIGDELKEGAIRSNYSNKLNVLRWVLLKRYEFWMEKGWITDGSTNLSIQEIGSNYDGRVSDRLLQMCHWKEFKFLTKGSFRQISETRKLKPEEIKANWKKVTPEIVAVKIDLVKYFNELLSEDVSFLGRFNQWGFVKKYLIKNELLSQELFDRRIDSKFMERAELIFKRQVHQSKRKELQHTKHFVRVEGVRRALENINDETIMEFAENMIAKEVFIGLKATPFKFK